MLLNIIFADYLGEGFKGKVPTDALGTCTAVREIRGGGELCWVAKDFIELYGTKDSKITSVQPKKMDLILGETDPQVSIHARPGDNLSHVGSSHAKWNAFFDSLKEHETREVTITFHLTYPDSNKRRRLDE